MKKYNVFVKEISYGCIEVEAESEEEAREIADRQYQMGFTEWSSGEYELAPQEIKPPEREEPAR